MGAPQQPCEHGRPYQRRDHVQRDFRAGQAACQRAHQHHEDATDERRGWQQHAVIRSHQHAGKVRHDQSLRADVLRVIVAASMPQ